MPRASGVPALARGQHRTLAYGTLASTPRPVNLQAIDSIGPALKDTPRPPGEWNAMEISLESDWTVVTVLPH